MARLDYEAAAASYDGARALPPDALAGWRAAVEPYLPPADGRPILDLGAGTGVFAAAFADWYAAPVIAVESAAAMRREATAHPNVAWLAGAAERMPLKDGSCGAAWLSTVIHHFDDLGAAAAEIARVLAPGAPALIRSAFPGRTGGVTLFRFFPAAGRAVESFPSVPETVAAFAAAGFEMEKLCPVEQRSAPSLAAFRARLSQRADTTLAALDDADFAAGLAALDAAVAAEAVSAPVVDRLDLLVLRYTDN